MDLSCPDPERCPVVPSLPALPGVTTAAGAAWYRCYRVELGYDECNPGVGSTRFAPFSDQGSGQPVPALYLAAHEAGALLETVFHEVHHMAARRIFERDLRHRALAYVLVPRELWLADLRDPVLATCGLQRDQVVSSPAEHYPCTRRLAQELHSRAIDGQAVQGVLWHSRHAELLGGEAAEVCVVFGDRYGARRGSRTLTGPGARNLFEGPGRLLVDEIASDLDAVVVPGS